MTNSGTSFDVEMGVIHNTYYLYLYKSSKTTSRSYQNIMEPESNP